MMIVRPIEQKDMDAYHGFAQLAAAGMTALPNNRTLLQRNITRSLESFKKQVSEPQDELYIFVLEDTEAGKVLGTCCIESKAGIHRPLYYYRLETVPNKPIPLPIEKEMEILSLAVYTHAPSKVCGLFIHPDARKGGLGKLLSLSRFLFIAAFPERFDKTIFAEMRGEATEEGVVPFWEAIGRHFLDISYSGLMKLYDEDFDFVPYLLPRFPIYKSMLPQSAQEAIGKTHTRTLPALAMLQEEGFHPSGEVDVFDAGPRVVCHTQEVQAVKNSRVIKGSIDGNVLMANDSLDFRCCYGSMDLETLSALHLNPGDPVRVLS